MGDKSKIEWTDATWNPTTGCSKVSPGCKHCFAERLFPRVYGREVVTTEGTHDVEWKGPTITVPNHRPRKFTDVQTHPDRLDQPLRWKKPRRIFVNSMSDLFHESVPDEFIDKVFAVISAADQHTYQILTKRPQRMREYMNSSATPDRVNDRKIDVTVGLPGGCKWNNWPVDPGFKTWPPKHAHLGVSVEDQPTAEERIPWILETPAAVRFVSYEPAIGAFDPTRLTIVKPIPPNGPGAYLNALTGHVAGPDDILPAKLDWIICGGESGPNARPMHPAWVRSLRDQCQAAGVPFFFKQWGEWAPVTYYEARGVGHPTLPTFMTDNQEVFALDVDKVLTGIKMGRVGKKDAGAMLDGREWREFPRGKGG